MNTMNDTMERASQALAAMEYLDAEALCLTALNQAKAQADWSDYARVLLPLQECRRQRRMIACDAGVRTTADGPADGCVVLLPPNDASVARELLSAAQADRRCLEVLLVTSQAWESRWRVESFDGPAVTCELPAPPGAQPDVMWYLAASEALGDAAIAQVDADPAAPLGNMERVARLEAMLDVVVDHEKLHQRLGDAARALLAATTKAGG